MIEFFIEHQCSHHWNIGNRQNKRTNKRTKLLPDCFARDRALPDLPPGALVALLDAGAYGATMSSTYNARPLAAEVLVDGACFAVVRDRQSYEALHTGQRLPDWLTG